MVTHRVEIVDTQREGEMFIEKMIFLFKYFFPPVIVFIIGSILFSFGIALALAIITEILIIFRKRIFKRRREKEHHNHHHHKHHHHHHHKHHHKHHHR